MKFTRIPYYFITCLVLATACTNRSISETDTATIRSVPIGLGWAQNSVNTVKFRHNSITTFDSTQFVGYYDTDGIVVLAKRNLGLTDWGAYNPLLA